MLNHLQKTALLPVVAGLALFVLSAVGSNVFNLHLTTAWFDVVLHFTGGVIVAWFIKNSFPMISSPIVILAGVLIIGGLWEVAEWWGSFGPGAAWPLYAKFMGIGSPIDTASDLLLDLLGGGILLYLSKTSSLILWERSYS